MAVVVGCSFSLLAGGAGGLTDVDQDTARILVVPLVPSKKVERPDRQQNVVRPEVAVADVSPEIQAYRAEQPYCLSSYKITR